MIKPPSTPNISRIADWIELFILVNNKEISKSKILSLISKEIKIDEENIDSAILELRRRLNLYGLPQPFNITGNIIKPKINWVLLPEHALCLFYSTYGAGKPDNGTKLFEEITKACTERVLNSHGYCFGSPSPISFTKQLDHFSKTIKQERFQNPGPHDKDRDVDIIISKEFDDSRDNQILLFIQCAAGKNWNDKKPVAFESYRRYMSFTLKSIVSSLAITQIVDIEDWRNATDDYGLILDRARLYRIYSTENRLIQRAIKSQLNTWCKDNLK